MLVAALAATDLKEAEEDGVDGHLVHVEEDVGDEVGAQDDQDDREEVVVQISRPSEVSQATCGL